MNKTNLNLTLVELLAKYVNEIAKVKYGNDTICPPLFIVSVMGYEEHQKIVLTVNHSGSCYSKILFPQPDVKYEYETIEKEMEWLYNRTM